LIVMAATTTITMVTMKAYRADANPVAVIRRKSTRYSPWRPTVFGTVNSDPTGKLAVSQINRRGNPAIRA
jgi:hypothetical protein